MSLCSRGFTGRAGQHARAQGRSSSYHTSEMHGFLKFKNDLKINLLADSGYIRANASPLWEGDSVGVKSSHQL